MLRNKQRLPALRGGREEMRRRRRDVETGGVELSVERKRRREGA